jgi:hypothetical protein
LINIRMIRICITHIQGAPQQIYRNGDAIIIKGIVS